MLTFGTGIGSALFVDGHLVPNTEFGHIQVDGEDGETRASAAAREREELSYPSGPSGSTATSTCSRQASGRT
jgi:polyphosphate glucokinase